MEHENGSGPEPAAPSPPEELSSPQLSAAAEQPHTEEPVSAAEPPEPRELAESPESSAAADDSLPAEVSETATSGDHADAEEAAKTWQATGEPRVDAALGRLSELDELPVSDHPGVYERVHEQLVDVLGELHQGTQNR